MVMEEFPEFPMRPAAVAVVRRLERLQELWALKHPELANGEPEPDPAPPPAQWVIPLPQRFATASVEAIEDERARARIGGWCDDPKGTLLLAGPVGSGKTWAAYAAARELAGRRSARVAVVSAIELLETMRPPTNVPFSFYVGLGVLAIDDLGPQKNTEWATEQLTGIVDKRWVESRPTIVTTNLTRPQLEEEVGPRIFSRLVNADSTTVTMAGRDRRQK